MSGLEPFHDRIVRSWLELEIDGDTLTQVLVIETDAERRAGQPGYDAGTIEEIKLAALGLFRLRLNRDNSSKFFVCRDFRVSR